jgi:hypothetical protein
MVMHKCVAAVVLMFTCTASFAQSQTPKLTAANHVEAQRVASDRELTNEGNFGDMHERLEREQIARLMAERQVQLRRDTEKLVALTAELKAQVDKTATNILSVDVIKKAAEIQKLAKSVEEKIKNAY